MKPSHSDPQPPRFRPAPTRSTRAVFGWLHSAVVAALILAAPRPCSAAGTGTKWFPGHYVRAGSDSDMAMIYGNSDFIGAQRTYAWRDLEPTAGAYNFQAIRDDRDALVAQGKKLVIRIETNSFTTTPKVPQYVVDATPSGVVYGSGTDPKAAIWRSTCYVPLIAFVNALGNEFDDDSNIAGFIFQETAIGNMVPTSDQPTTAEYVQSLKDRMRDAKAAFPKTPIFQNANYFPLGDGETAMPDLVQYFYAEKLGGISCPDAQVDTASMELHGTYKTKIPLGTDNQKATTDFPLFFTSAGGRDVHDMWDLITSELWREELNNGNGKMVGRWANYVFWATVSADMAPNYPSASQEWEQVFNVTSGVPPEHTVVSVVAARGFPTANLPLPEILRVAPASKLVATPLSASAIALSWLDNSNNELVFEIERKTGAGTYAVVGTTAANGTGFSDSGLLATTTYNYRVRAINAAGDYSSYSLEASATTQAGGGNGANWRFDESSGNTAADSTGNGHNGTANGATIAVGYSGNSRSFDGVNDEVAVADANGLDFTNTIYFDARIRFATAATPNNAGTVYRLIGKANSGSEQYGVKIDAGKIGLMWAGGSWVLTSALSWANDTWYRVEITHDGANVTFKRDGVTIGTVANSAVASPSDGVLYIGRGIPGFEKWFLGRIDEVTLAAAPGVVGSTPIITTAALPATIAGESYSHTLAATGGDGALTWSLDAGSLPTGISLASNGVLTGNATTAGTSNFTVRVADSDGNVGAADEDTQALSIVVTANSVPSITTTALPGMIAGEAYSQALAATGGNGALAWSLDSGALPAGLSLSSSGTISGNATTAGTSNFTVRVADSDGNVGAADEDTQALSIVVTANSVPSITTTALPGMIAGEAYSQALAATGGNGALAWSLDSGALPAGLSLSSSGTISGNATTAGISNFTVRVADSDGNVGAADEDTQALSIVVTANSVPSITTTSLPAGTVNSAYSQTLAATGGNGALGWSLASGTLPAGLSLSAAGAISGTPTTAGTSNFTVRVVDSDANTGAADEDTQALSIVIDTPVGGGNWRFNETTGTSVADSSGNGHTGTASAGATVSNPGFDGTGSCRSFNGTSGSVTVPDANDLDFTNTLYIDARINFASGAAPNAGSTAVYRVIGKEPAGAEPYGVRVRAGKLGLVWNNVWIESTVAVTWNANTWYRIEVIHNGSNITFRRDGVAIGTAVANSAVAPISTGSLYIGRGVVGYEKWFLGKIDEVSLRAAP